MEVPNRLLREREPGQYLWRGEAGDFPCRSLGIPADSAPHRSPLVARMARVEQYANEASRLARAGAQGLVLDLPGGMSQARTALLGARQGGLPVHVILAVDEDGETRDGCAALAALLVLQALGAASLTLGLEATEAPWLEELPPYAAIPLLAECPDGAEPARIEALLRLGLDGFTGPADLPCPLPPLLPAKPPRPEDAPLLLAGPHGVSYLEEDFSVSEPADCGPDIPALLLDLEDTGADVLLFHVETTEDAEALSGSVNMARDAVGILAEGEEALEAALLGYDGLALVDSRSDVTEDRLAFLAKGYGASIR